jgi:enoyl-CoA hydratase/carnithine racemase
MSAAWQSINYETRNGYACLTLNRPQALNAIDPPMLAEMGRATSAAEADDTVSALIVTGAGERAFCAGMDLRAFQARAAAAKPMELRAMRRSTRHPFATMHKPVIAAVNGLAYGGGLELVLLCDIVVAAEHATFAAAEVSRGLIPGNGATQRLPRRIGPVFALEMLLTGLPVDARKALRIGLINDVVGAADLLPAAERIAGAIAMNGPVAVRLAKEAALRGMEMPLEKGLELESDLLTLAQSTDDAKEGVRAFIEKRKPAWTGK